MNSTKHRQSTKKKSSLNLALTAKATLFVKSERRERRALKTTTITTIIAMLIIETITLNHRVLDLILKGAVTMKVIRISTRCTSFKSASRTQPRFEVAPSTAALARALVTVAKNSEHDVDEMSHRMVRRWILTHYK